MEPSEIPEFTKQMAESGGDAEPGQGKGTESLTRISLAISVLAVLVAMVTVLGHRAHTEAVLAQARAGDQWNQYQAKKIRADQSDVAADLLELQPTYDAARTGRRVVEYRSRTAKWRADLLEEEQHARELEAEVVRAERQAGRFDLGEALLQIAVVLCSITLFTRRRAPFLFGLALGGTGLLCAASAFRIALT